MSGAEDYNSKVDQVNPVFRRDFLLIVSYSLDSGNVFVVCFILFNKMFKI